MKTLNTGFLALLRNKTQMLESDPSRAPEAKYCRDLLKRAERAVMYPDQIGQGDLEQLDSQVKRCLGIRLA